MGRTSLEQYTGSARLNVRDLTRAYRASHAFRGRLAVVTALGAGSAALFGLTFELPWWQALSVLGLVWFSAWRLPSRLASGRMRRAEGPLAHFRVDDEGLCESPPERLVAWTDARAMRETDAAYVLDVPGELPFVLPKQAFDAETRPRLRVLLESRAQPAAAITGRAIVAVAAASAIALVWFVARAM